MNEPQHQQIYRAAYTEHQLCNNRERRKELEEVMERAETQFTFEEFWDFWGTLNVPNPNVIVTKFQGTP